MTELLNNNKCILQYTFVGHISDIFLPPASMGATGVCPGLQSQELPQEGSSKSRRHFE